MGGVADLDARLDGDVSAGDQPDVTGSSAKSQALFARAQAVMPGGVNSPVRAMRQIGRTPPFIAEARGAGLTDVDGNTYVDYICSWGPLILGHADAGVVAAIEAAARHGASYGAPTELEVLLAEAITERVPSVEMVRMTSSGTEAAMSAIRLARAATGRDKILKFAGAYHGHSDGLLAAAGSGLATLAVPGSPGVTAAQAADTVVIPWNDPTAFAQACKDHDFAAIIAEPCPANMGVIPPAAGFLNVLKAEAEAAGALLIFDEVISGFRVARGGAQEVYGVSADLTVFGKVIGGGLPAAAYGGRRDLMTMIAPAGDVYQAGTLSGNPLAMAAGLATLERLDNDAYEQLAATTSRLADGLKGAADQAGIAAAVVSLCGLVTTFFNSTAPVNFAEAQQCDLDAHASWCRELLDRGVYPPPSQFEAWFPSLVHDDATVDRTIELAALAFAATAQRSASV